LLRHVIEKESFTQKLPYFSSNTKDFSTGEFSAMTFTKLLKFSKRHGAKFHPNPETHPS
jgi:hypothetical protein